MTSEKTHHEPLPDAESASEKSAPVPRRGPGAAPTPLPTHLVAVLDDYTAALTAAPLAAETRRTYVSKVRQFLVWLALADVAGNPLATAAARDWAVRDYRTYLQRVAKRAPATVNTALAAVDDFFLRRGQGPAKAERVGLPSAAPRALDQRATLRFLRAVDAHASPRDRALALVPFYAGARIAETVQLDVADVRTSARKGALRLFGKGAKVREVPMHAQLRLALTAWLEERPDWPKASDNPALFLNQAGGRLTVRGASAVFTAIAAAAQLDEAATAHILRHTFATTLVRGGADLVLVAELLGHARLKTTRGYTRPTAADRLKALDFLPVDR
jgi:integrase/recombinase XerC